MAPPWGTCWRKCPTRSYPRGSVEAPSRLRRGSAEERSMFLEAFKKTMQKNTDLSCFGGRFWQHLASILAPFWDELSRQLLDLFSMRFVLIVAPFVITPTFNFGALAYTPCDFSSFRHVAKSAKTTSNYHQNYTKNQPNINK